MNESVNIDGYGYADSGLNSSHAYLLPALRMELSRITVGDKRLFDLGCGNGSIAASVSKDGWDVTGVDVSREGIEQARRAYPKLRLETGSAYDELAAKYGRFPVAISLEVVEHLYDPRRYARVLFDLLEPGGTAIVSTPYHGYMKNLVLAVMGKMDAHFHALWDHGHIKFWSVRTLNTLLTEVGFEDVQFRKVGRVPPLAKSMIAIARKKAN